MSEENIFNARIIDDLPESLQEQVWLAGRTHDTKRLVSLFDIKQELTLAEILIGMFRKFGIEKQKKWAVANIHNLIGAGILVRTGKGLYRKA